MPDTTTTSGLKQLIHRLVAAARRELREADARRDLAFSGLFGSGTDTRG